MKNSNYNRGQKVTYKRNLMFGKVEVVTCKIVAKN
jgi:hypothetical protein